MSYVRFGKNSDVYMYGGYPFVSGTETEEGYEDESRGEAFICCACRLSEREARFIDSCEDKTCNECYWWGDTNCFSVQDAIAHLDAHKAAGHKVPKSAYKELQKVIDNSKKG